MSYPAARNAAAVAARCHLTAPEGIASYASIRTGGLWAVFSKAEDPAMPLRLSIPLFRGPFSYSTALRKGNVLVRPLMLPFRASAKSHRKAQQNNREIRAAYQARRAGR